MISKSTHSPGSEVAALGSSGSWLNRLRMPALATSGAALIVGALIASLTEIGPVAERFSLAYGAVLALAALCLVIAAAIPRPAQRSKGVYFAAVPAGIMLGAVTFNGMSTAIPRVAFAVAAIAAFVVAALALMADLESSRDRPVNRM